MAALEARLLARIDHLQSELTASRIESAALKQELQGHLAQYQEWDRRRWGLLIVLFGAVMSMATAVLVTLARK